MGKKKTKAEAAQADATTTNETPIETTVETQPETAVATEEPAPEAEPPKKGKGKKKRAAAPFLLLEIRPRAEWTLEEFERLLAQQMEWWHTRARPEYERMNADGRLHGQQHVLQHLDQYEPAGTMLREHMNLGLYDYDGDVRRMARGLAMHDQGTKKPRGREPLSIDAHFEYFALAGKGDRCIQKVDRDGRISVVPLRIKSGMDARVGPTKRRRETVERDLRSKDAGFSLMNHADKAVEPEPFPFALVEAAKVIAARRMAGRRRGSLHWRVLSEIEPLATKELKPAKLARELGVTSHAIRKAFREECAVIRERLGA